MRRATEMASCVDFASHAWALFDEVKGHFTRNHNNLKRSDSESTSVFAIKNDLNVNSAFLSFHFTMAHVFLLLYAKGLYHRR